ncbi:MAG: inorganic diphosphatase [Vitreoscilla sp.]
MLDTARASGIAALAPWDEQGRLRAVIEAPRGRANKLKFQPELGVFELHKVLPLGCVFPFDFGFVPGTLGQDGDPLDVLVVMDEPTVPGVVVPCQLLGVIVAEQQPIKQAGRAKPTRNDRLIAVAHESHRHPGCRSLRDLGDGMLAEMERFFVFYNEQKGVRFTPLERAGVAQARRLVSEGRRAAQG